jgi:hypothetical protein
MKPDHLRALTLLADHPEGCTEALMLAQGFGPAVIAELIEAGLARAKTERILTGHGRSAVKVTRLRITDAGRAVIEGSRMANPATQESIAADLSATERVLLFCIGSDTDWQKFVPYATAQQMMIRGLLNRDDSGFTLTDQGRAVLETLMMRAPTRGQ